jgi:hypothetical protein
MICDLCDVLRLGTNGVTVQGFSYRGKQRQVMGDVTYDGGGCLQPVRLGGALMHEEADKWMVEELQRASTLDTTSLRRLGELRRAAPRDGTGWGWLLDLQAAPRRDASGRLRLVEL